MVELGQVFDAATLESFSDEALCESLTIAELAHEGVIPRSQLPRLYIVLDGERPLLVSDALETLDAMIYEGDA